MHPIEYEQDKLELEIDEEWESKDNLLMNSSRWCLMKEVGTEVKNQLEKQSGKGKN
jgi:hypothetical protein